MTTFWLSFADPDKQPGTQFLGVSIIQADRFLDAVITAKQLGCNPGGEVMGYQLPDELTVSKAHLGRLMQKEELELLEASFRRQLSQLH